MLTVTEPKQQGAQRVDRDQSSHFEQDGRDQVNQSHEQSTQQGTEKPKSFEVDLMDDWFKS